jgi:Zn-dependent protease
LSVKHRVILKEIERIENPRTGMAYKLLVLAVSVGLFIQMQVITGSVTGLAAILIVLFIHEMGHLAAMKLSGYANVQMFFIPFFGAAVSGTEVKPDPLKKAAVSLMGPLPGILLGFLALVIAARTGIEQFRDYGNVSLVINILNLLPFYPLDGGQFFDAVLFSRSPRLDIVFKIIGALGLALLALALGSVAIGIVAVLVLITIRSAAVTARVATALKREGYAAPGTGKVPEPFVADVAGRIEKAFGTRSMNSRNMARQVLAVWNRVRLAPPKAATAALFTFLYLFLFSGSIFSAIVITAALPLGDSIEMKAFTSREGGFTVNMPAEPRYNRQVQNEGGKSMEMHSFSSDYFRTAFAVMYFDLPAAVDDARRNAMLKAVSDGTAAQLRGRVLDDRPVALGAHRGKEFALSLPDGMYLVSRIFIAGRRVFQLTLVTPEVNRGSKVIRVFTDSFALTGEPGQNK